MQSEIDSLRQRITELEVEKAELEAKNSEIPELRKKLAEFEVRVVEIHELRKKVADVEARNAELIKQIMEENNRRDARIEVLEKNKTDTTDRIPTLEHKHSQNDITNNNPSNLNSGADHHEKPSQEKEMDEMHKKSVCDEIRRRNKEKKIQRETDTQDVASDPACTADTFAIVNNLVESESQNIDKINSCTSSESSREIKVVANTSQDYAQKCIANSVVDSKVPHDIKTVNDQDKSAVEPNIVTEFVQGLLEELLSSDSRLLESIKFSPPRTLIPGSLSIKKLANLFCQSIVTRKKSIIAKREEISSWGCFSERFEDKVVELRSGDKKLTDQTARKRIYDEMVPYLTDVTDGYLRVMTCKARKINKLFGYEYDPVTLKKNKGIGWHMVQRVTCSADRISRLTNPQIEYIIKQVKSKTITSHVNKIFETVVKSSNVVTPAKANDHNDDDSDSGNVDSGSNSDSDESIDSNHPHDILLREEIARLERISNYPGNSAPTPQMTPVKVDNYNDVYFEEEDLKEEEVESNEVKSDDENNSEEEIDESDNDGYSGCGGYNEYGESDREIFEVMNHH
ncbi:17713_t:CDS:2 [Gigaspora rosea]|nr:17713_t:CDS:2 [Gigaspora rosea]